MGSLPPNIFHVLPTLEELYVCLLLSFSTFFYERVGPSYDYKRRYYNYISLD